VAAFPNAFLCIRFKSDVLFVLMWLMSVYESGSMVLFNFSGGKLVRLWHCVELLVLTYRDRSRMIGV
jgi:hypothetical protein